MKTLPFAGFSPLFALVLFLTFLFGCRKDIINESSRVYKEPSLSQDLTVENAKKAFEERKNTIVLRTDSTFTSLLSQVQPLWEFADTIIYMGQTPIIAVPCDQCTANFPRNEKFLAFFLDSTSQIVSRLVLIESAENYQFSETFFQNFTGDILQIDWEDHLVNSVRFEDGVLAATISLELAITERNENLICDWEPFYYYDPPWACAPQ
ncbi:MAG: hypothetical protein OHK0019_35870 [Saprospiraceae bacterium]